MQKGAVMSEKKKRLVAYHEAGHAIVGALMPEYDPVTKISIVPRGAAGGLTFFAPSEERLESGLYSRNVRRDPVLLPRLFCLRAHPLVSPVVDRFHDQTWALSIRGHAPVSEVAAMWGQYVPEREGNGAAESTC
jgi:Peptidase family M41